MRGPDGDRERGDRPTVVSANGPPSVICAGHVNWDVTLRVDSLPEPDGEALIEDESGAGGGSASNVAAGLAGLDCTPALLGSVGDDDNGQKTVRELTEAGVDCSAVRQVADRKTTVKYLVVDDRGEVMVLAAPGANEEYLATDLPRDALADASLVHLTGQSGNVARSLVERARTEDVPVSVDPGRRLQQREFDAVIRRADLLFCNELEAETARNRGLLADHDGRVLIKRGADGATLHDGSRTLSHEGFTVEATNTAGAGDAFAAGFIAALLDAADDERALVVGNACGALAARSLDTRVPLSWSAIGEFLPGANPR